MQELSRIVEKTERREIIMEPIKVQINREGLDQLRIKHILGSQGRWALLKS
jgi:hypothetical protein